MKVYVVVAENVATELALVIEVFKDPEPAVLFAKDLARKTIADWDYSSEDIERFGLGEKKVEGRLYCFDEGEGKDSIWVEEKELR